MRIGNLRRRLVFQTKPATQDSFGQQTAAWTDVLTNVPAEIDALAGRELLAAQAVNAELTHLLTVRFHSLLADPIKVAAMRAVYVTPDVTRYFNLSPGINVDERNRVIQIAAGEGLNQG